MRGGVLLNLSFNQTVVVLELVDLKMYGASGVLGHSGATVLQVMARRRGILSAGREAVGNKFVEMRVGRYWASATTAVRSASAQGAPTGSGASAATTSSPRKGHGKEKCACASSS